MRVTIWMPVIAAGVAGVLSTVWLRPVEARKPRPAAGPCADDEEARTRARQEARAAEREAAAARADQQRSIGRLQEMERDRVQIERDLEKAIARRVELEKVLVGKLDKVQER